MNAEDPQVAEQRDRGTRGTGDGAHGLTWLLEMVHEVAHAHAGQDAECMFLPHAGAPPAKICGAMTPETSASLLSALRDAGVDADELLEPVRLYLPGVAGNEHALLLPLSSQTQSAGVLVVAAPAPPLGRAGLNRTMELATNGLSWLADGAQRSERLEQAAGRSDGLAQELAELRIHLALQEQLVAARTTGDLVARLSSWLDAGVAVQMPNLIVAEAAGPGARELALSTQRTDMERAIVSRSTNRGRVLPLIPASGRLPARVVAPIEGPAGEFAGFLIAAVGSSGVQATRRAMELSLGLVAYQLSIRQDIEQSVESLRQNLLTDLLADNFSDDLATQAAKLGHDLAAVHLSLAVAPLKEANSGLALAAADAELLGVVKRLCAQATGSTVAPLVGIVDGMVVAFVPDPVPAGAAALAEAVRTASANAGLDVIVGIGPACPAPAQMPATADRARWAVLVLSKAGSGGGTRVAEFDDLGMYGLLFDHHRATDLAAFAQKWLGPLLDYDDKHRSELVDTLRQLFRQRSLADTAAELHIHVSTLKYRIQRIESVLGKSVENWDNVFHLELALRILAISDYLGLGSTK